MVNCEFEIEIEIERETHTQRKRDRAECGCIYLFGRPFVLPSRFLQALPTLPISGS